MSDSQRERTLAPTALAYESSLIFLEPDV